MTHQQLLLFTKKVFINKNYIKIRSKNLKKIISAVLVIGIIFMSCSKKKEDNSLRDLSILGILTNFFDGNGEKLSLTGGVSVKQKISVTSGQEFKYTITQGKDSTGETFENRVVISILDTNNNEVYGTITLPGVTEIISYTPKATGEFTVMFIPYNTTTLKTVLTGATSISSSLKSANSRSIASPRNDLVGKGKYYIKGGFIQAVFPIINVYEVTGLENRKPVLSEITNASVIVEVDGTAYTLPYSLNPGFSQPPAYSLQNIGGSVIGKKLQVKITHPTISDINYDQTLTAVPNFVSNVTVNGESTVNNNGKTIEIDKTQPITYTWTNSSANTSEITTQLGIKDGAGGDVFLYVPASLGRFTISKDLLSGLTPTSSKSSDDCIGIIGGATSAAVYDPEYFTGLAASGEAKSGFSVLIFNFPNPGYQAAEGNLCEEDVVNIVAKQFLGGNPTFSSLGTPKLIVK